MRNWGCLFLRGWGGGGRAGLVSSICSLFLSSFLIFVELALPRRDIGVRFSVNHFFLQNHYIYLAESFLVSHNFECVLQQEFCVSWSCIEFFFLF